ncbi:hypothetical protein AFK24_06325 [Pseudomonas syringae]|uniref:DUF202 domain-containing protein n=1 Tax=Pseudomonas syringae TaxID=317 RepID=A0A1C7ZAS7_PSESX|nr:hypothetical protein AFK24_06325 [Pseudomonas syringae]
MSDLSDARVFFATERTLLALHRTRLSLMALGFMIERSGLLLQLLKPRVVGSSGKHFPFWIVLAFPMLRSWVAAVGHLPKGCAEITISKFHRVFLHAT